MSKNDKNMEIATFRFGLISEFVTGVKLNYGEKEQLIREKLSREYKIPYSDKTQITRPTLMKWVGDYKKAGNRIEGLFPRNRKDKGKYRSLCPSLQMAIKEIKSEKTGLKGQALISELKHRKIIGHEEKISLSVLYKFLKGEDLLSPLKHEGQDRRAFEASYPNELWQSDVMHGPRVWVAGKKRKTYLTAIMDDHSRLITHAEFYLSEKMSDFKNCLKKAIEKRGLPQKLYTDNGSCFSALNIEQITACLGIALKKAKPYSPEGKGKIERWFRYVRDNFLSTLPEEINFKELNERFDDWVEGYQNRKHSSLGCSPHERFKTNIQCVRPAPPDLIEYFRLIEFRRVKKDRTIRLGGCIYEAPVKLIDEQVELRFHQESPEQVEIFFDGRSFGEAVLLDKNVNFKIGRNSRVKGERKSIDPKSGELFNKGKNNE